jgi:ribosomal protein S18 acetylase RimI-like enzyme
MECIMSREIDPETGRPRRGLDAGPLGRLIRRLSFRTLRGTGPLPVRAKDAAGPVRIRPIRKSDAPAFREVLDAVSRERTHLAFVEAPPLADVLAYVAERIKKKDVQIVAERAGELVGWCDVVRLELPGFGHSGRLGMGVVRHHRGAGIGSALLAEALRRARENGLTRVELEVFASNRAAIGLYRKYGFRMEGKKIGARILDGGPEDLAVMGLRLGEPGVAGPKAGVSPRPRRIR